MPWTECESILWPLQCCDDITLSDPQKIVYLSMRYYGVHSENQRGWNILQLTVYVHNINTSEPMWTHPVHACHGGAWHWCLGESGALRSFFWFFGHCPFCFKNRENMKLPWYSSSSSLFDNICFKSITHIQEEKHRSKNSFSKCSWCPNLSSLVSIVTIVLSVESWHGFRSWQIDWTLMPPNKVCHNETYSL